jgi:hypothetical protein
MLNKELLLDTLTKQIEETKQGIISIENKKISQAGIDAILLINFFKGQGYTMEEYKRAIEDGKFDV